MRKRNLVITGLVCTFILVVLSFANILPQTGIVFAIDNTAFRNMYVEQYSYNVSNSWCGIANFTASGGSAKITSNQLVNFTIQVILNNTYATSSSDALFFTWIGMNITYGGGPTYVFNNVTLNNNTSAVSYGANNDWLITACGNWTSSLPTGGTTYTIAVVYEAQY